MLALWLENQQLRLRDDVSTPVPPVGEALVRVLRAGVCNTDLELVKGYYPFTGIPGHEFVGQVEAARSALLEARAAAEEKGERTMLWQILATLSDLERKSGHEAEAEKLRDQAREIIDYIADHAGTDELRSAFLAQPAVVRVLDQG